MDVFMHLQFEELLKSITCHPVLSSCDSVHPNMLESIWTAERKSCIFDDMRVISLYFRRYCRESWTW